MANKIDWKSIPGLVGGVIKELAMLPVEAAENAFNYLKDNKSEAARVTSASAQNRKDIIAGIISSDRPSPPPPIGRREGQGASTANAATPTFAGLSPDESIKGVEGSGGSISNATFAGSANSQGTEVAPKEKQHSSDKTKEEGSKVIEALSIGEDFASLEQLQGMSESGLSDIYNKIYGRSPGNVLKGQLPEVLFRRLQEALNDKE